MRLKDELLGLLKLVYWCSI